MKGHSILLSELFEFIDKENIKTILDAGSGKTSLNSLVKEFPNAKIDAVVYYHDERKKNSIRENVKSGDYELKEMDIVKDSIPKKYDLVLAHLLLGEALKWGNKTNDLLDKLLMIHAKYFVIVDIKEDTSIDYDYIESQINSKYHLLAKKEIKK